MPERLFQLSCLGRNSAGEPALQTPVTVTISARTYPENDHFLAVMPQKCPHNTGGHGQRCKASHPGVDKIEGAPVLCPFSFDFPYVREQDASWQPPEELLTAAREQPMLKGLLPTPQ